MLSIPHLILIFVIALIAFGPEKLPQLARTLGKAMAEFRKVTGDLRRVVDDEMREIERQTREAEIRKRDAAAQASLPNAPVPALQAPDATPAGEHVIAPPPSQPYIDEQQAESPGTNTESLAEPSIAPPGTIPATPPSGAGYPYLAESSTDSAAEAPPNGQSKPA